MTAPSTAHAGRDVPDPLTGIVRRLSAEYGEHVPPVTVVRCVEAARGAVGLFGEDAATMPQLVERIAREDLRVLTTGQKSLARLKPMNRSRRDD